MRRFKENMIGALSKVHSAYPEARFEVEAYGLRLLPSKTHGGMLPSFQRLTR